MTDERLDKDQWLADLAKSNDRGERIDQWEALQVVGELIRTRAVLRRLVDHHEGACRGNKICFAHGFLMPCPVAEARAIEKRLREQEGAGK